MCLLSHTVFPEPWVWRIRAGQRRAGSDVRLLRPPGRATHVPSVHSRANQRTLLRVSRYDIMRSGVGAYATDRHVPAAASDPATRTPPNEVMPGVKYAENLKPDADVDQFWCCTAEYSGGTWQHDRACPMARRRPA